MRKLKQKKGFLCEEQRTVDNMTEEQMRERIEELERERDKLKDEIRVYEKSLYDQELARKFEERKKYIGKCFETKDTSRSIKAFKILGLEHLELYNAKCVVLVDENDCYGDYGIKILKLGIWYPDVIRAMMRADDPKFIDFYTEISEKKFEKLYKHYEQQLEATVFI